MTVRSWRPSVEEAALLNRSFCSILLWAAADGYSTESEALSEATPPSLPYELSFLVLPVILHRLTREALPMRVSTSLGTWLSDRPLVVAQFGLRAKALFHYSRAALLFGLSYRLLLLDGGLVHAQLSSRNDLKKTIKGCTAEVGDCFKRAFFLGRWFARAGSPVTVMALWGVRP